MVLSFSVHLATATAVSTALATKNMRAFLVYTTNVERHTGRTLAGVCVCVCYHCYGDGKGRN